MRAIDAKKRSASQAFGHAGKPKLLHYDLQKMIHYGGLTTLGTMGTVRRGGPVFSACLFVFSTSGSSQRSRFEL